MTKYPVHLKEDNSKTDKKYQLCFYDDEVIFERVWKSKIIIAYKDMDFVMFGAEGEGSILISERNGDTVSFVNNCDNRSIMSSFVSKNVRVTVV
ncbi:MAG: hypothetical protein II711_00470 [Clostridia bacterium]|nr:hypothetical protein [Clostridia bacterium]